MSALHIGIADGDGNISTSVKNTSIAVRSLANEALEVLDAAIDQMSVQRTDLGAIQNRLEHAVNSLGVTAENLQNAESLIRDADMAEEMMGFTKSNILAQVAQSMLAQANLLPQDVLQLLR